MKKNTLRLMAVTFAASFMFAGCGSSSTTVVVDPSPAPTVAPTPAPTNTPGPTPEPTDTPVDEGKLLPSFK